MVGRSRSRARLFALFILGTLFLLPPLLEVFNRPVRFLGIPVLYLYIFLGWAALIAFSGILSQQVVLDLTIPSDDDAKPGDGADVRSATPEAATDA